jgi:hypothetical protein
MMRTMSRDFYIPSGAAKMTPKSGGVVFYLSEMPGRFIVKYFVGKAQKPSGHYHFSSADKRAAYIGRVIEGVEATAAYKAERAARKKAEAEKGHGWEPGLILVASWGYEQTNVDFYEVVEVLGKSMVKIEAIGSVQATDDTGGGSSMSNYVVPDPTKRSGEFQRCKVISGRVKVSSCSSAGLWDGKKRYCSWYA